MAKPPIEIPGPLGNRRHRRHRRVLAAARRRSHPALALLREAIPRALDITVSATLLMVLSPLLAVRALASRLQSGTALTGITVVGRYRTPFRQLSFSGSGPCRGLAAWLNVLRGDLALVGPRAMEADEAATVPVEDAVRFTVRPGLISTFGVRSRVGIAYERESAMDRDMVYEQSLKGDLGLTTRSVVSGILSGKSESREVPPLLNFFGIPVVNTTMAEAVHWVVSAAQGDARRLMAFVNPDCLNIAWNNGDYREMLVHADRVLPDGIGLHIGCRMMGQALRANVNGTDLFPMLCEAAAREGTPIYLLGARPGVARAAADNMIERYPGLQVAGARDGYFNTDEEAEVVSAINNSGARILLVAFGAPRQDLWLQQWRSQLVPPVAMGVGGLFDFYSGRIPRAPVWMRELGLEWVYRLLREPGRMWRRYVIGNPVFLYRVRQQARHPERFPLPACSERKAPDLGLQSLENSRVGPG